MIIESDVEMAPVTDSQSSMDWSVSGLPDTDPILPDANSIPVWAPRFKHLTGIQRQAMLQKSFANANISVIPAYRVLDDWVMMKNNYTINDLVDYCKNRIWLEKWADYGQLLRVQWRQHGYGSKVYQRNPFVSCVEARALQILKNKLGDKLDNFLTNKAVGIPLKLKTVIDSMDIENHDMKD